MIITHGVERDQTSISYHEEPYHLWTNLLEEVAATQFGIVRVPVSWGVHENLPGVTDFWKSPRLRLEKFIQLASSRNVPIEIVLGFHGIRGMFPEWAVEMPRRTLVPFDRSPEDPGILYVSSVPSLFDANLRRSFFNFVSEVVDICALYLEPEGSIRSVGVDLRLFQSSLNLMEEDIFSSLLAERYSDIHTLNLRYQTSFRDFGSLCTMNAMRVLMSKRPWLAAFDYKWCRQRAIDRLFEELNSLPSVQALGKRLYFTSDAKEETRAQSNIEILFDSTLIEKWGSSASPFAPGGYVVAEAIRIFRLYECLKDQSNTTPCSISCLDELCGDWLPMEKTVTVFCGKYLSRKSVDHLEKALELETRIFFGHEYPIFDENMTALEWARSTGWHRCHFAGDQVEVQSSQKGALFRPSSRSNFLDEVTVEDLIKLHKTLSVLQP